ncbi:MAG: pyruvate kinase [bacterium]|nr:pyruvate kinase [bacterium]
MKLTKIVCTIGPASQEKSMMEKLVHAGMNVARLNFSHGTYENHALLIKNVRAVAKKVGQPLAILQDLQGPRIRIGDLPKEGVEIKKGEDIVLVPQKNWNGSAKQKQLPNQYVGLAKDVKAGNHILIADGVMDLKVVKVLGDAITCRVIAGGIVKSHKGINVPGVTLKTPAITAKDKKDVVFGVSQGVDYIALSFVKDAKDITRLRALTKKAKASAQVGIIAKIERPEAVENFDEILDAVDGIMIARGDLGIEVPAQKVPIIQKQLIKKCIVARKPVIVATQMLESMIQNRRPTRAEVSDVANAVIDHTDAVMLSGESATGLYPYETVQIMAKTLSETEHSKYDDYTCANLDKEKTIAEMMAHVATTLAWTKEVRCIVVDDPDPRLVRHIAAHRSELRIVAFHGKAIIRQQLNLVRGVTAYPLKKDVASFLKNEKIANKGDKVLFVESNEIEIETLR